MPAPPLKPFSWSKAETYAERKNNQEDKILRLRIRKIDKEQMEAKQQKFEKVRKIKKLTEDLGESTGYVTNINRLSGYIFKTSTARTKVILSKYFPGEILPVGQISFSL